MKYAHVIPELTVSNLHVSKEFYIDALGFRIAYEREEDQLVLIELEGIQLMLEQVNGHWMTGELSYPFGRGVNFQLSVQSVEPMLDRINIREIPLFREVMINTYSGHTQKEFIVQDPDGYLLRFKEDM